MKRLFLAVLISLWSVSASSALFPSASAEISLEGAWAQFLVAIDRLESKPLVDASQLSRYPQALLLSSSQYPRFESYSWAQIQALVSLNRRCDPTEVADIQAKLAASVDVEQASVTQAGFRRAFAFELALCKGTELTDVWFLQGPALHPAGCSYADRYLAYLSERFTQDHPSVKRFMQQRQDQLTLANVHHPLHELLPPLTPQGVDALLSGHRVYLTPDNALWRTSPRGIERLSLEVWQPIAKALGVGLTPMSEIKFADSPKQASTCGFVFSNLCLQRLSTAAYVWPIVLSLIGLMCLGFVIKSLLLRRAEMQERRFILQLLTHELRTPITSLGSTVEQFRRQFDALNTPLQLAFGRLLADYQRLSQLTDTSRGFLTPQADASLPCQSASLTDWLEHCLTKFSLSYELDDSQAGSKNRQNNASSDIQNAVYSLPYYWLGVCLDNLIRNAQQHGKAPIRIEVAIKQPILSIRVFDQGQGMHWHQRVSGLWQPANKREQDNMGVGLVIVRRLMKKMGGRLIRHNRPTCFELELPL